MKFTTKWSQPNEWGLSSLFQDIEAVATRLRGCSLPETHWASNCVKPRANVHNLAGPSLHHCRASNILTTAQEDPEIPNTDQAHVVQHYQRIAAHGHRCSQFGNVGSSACLHSKFAL